LDTECDLAIEAAGDSRTEEAIAQFRHRLLGEHLGVAPGKFSETLTSEKSLLAAVEKLRGEERTLEPLQVDSPEWGETSISASAIADPERPIAPDRFIEEHIPEEVRKTGANRFRSLAIFLLLLLGLSAAWRWTPLRAWLTLERLSGWIGQLRGEPAAPFVVVGAYLLGSLTLVPVSLLIFATALAFGPFVGFTYSLLGCLLGAMLTYAVGMLLERDSVRRLAGSPLNKLSRRLAKHGLLTVVTVRVLPVAPFTIVNLVLGASHVRFRDLVLGTLIGMAPGIAAITVFENRLETAIREPKILSFAMLAVLLAVIVAFAVMAKRKLGNNKGTGSGYVRTNEGNEAGSSAQ
jgi:uncharacterized membrane protein YdjX (TVP38/TMEM64 family)